MNTHIHKFNMPDALDELWDICFDLSLTGQKEVKEQCVKMLA